MSTDPDTVRDNSGSLRNHRSSRALSLSTPTAASSSRAASTPARDPFPLSPTHHRRRLTASSGDMGYSLGALSALAVGAGRLRTPSMSLQAAATLNAAEQRDAITTLTPQERKSVSVGAAGAGLVETDEITTLTSSFVFTRPDYAGGAHREASGGNLGPPAVPFTPAALSPRTITASTPTEYSNDTSGNADSINFSPRTPSIQPPPPFPSHSLSSTAPSPLSRTSSQRRRSAIALNLMLADPTLPSPGELASCDRRASFSSSNMAPAYGYARRTGSIAGSAGSPGGSSGSGGYIARSLSRSISMGRGSRTRSGVESRNGARSLPTGGNSSRRLSMGDLHQVQEQEHERIVLRLFSRIHALETEVARLRLSAAQRHHRSRRHARATSPGIFFDPALDTETDSPEETGGSTLSESLTGSLDDEMGGDLGGL